MFRKPSTVNGAPKVEPKYESKYNLKSEPKFEDTYKKYLKESHMIEQKSEDTAAISSTSKRIIIIHIKNLDSSIDDDKL